MQSECLHVQAHCESLQAKLQHTSDSLEAALKQAERTALQSEAAQQSRDAAAAQARSEEVAGVREHADRCSASTETTAFCFELKWASASQQCRLSCCN